MKLSSPRPVVCVQGLGFVGTAMAAAVASARGPDGEPVFTVIGVDLPNEEGQKKVASVNEGIFPFESRDTSLARHMKTARLETGNLSATTDPEVYKQAAVVIVDINCDVIFSDGKPRLSMEGFKRAIHTLGTLLQPGALVIVETTVPPGTCAKVAAPELEACLKQRNLPANSILLAHSYERVMPGKNYYDSIVNFWRVYSGHTPEAAAACKDFLSQVINVKEYPLTLLHSTTAGETAKVLENSYRATTIAFIEEWGRFAEAVGVDMFEVLDAIRMRPTHSNIRQPGFGVGGYCLTKDPLFTELAAAELFHKPELKFPFSTQAVAVNNRMPLVSLEKAESMLGGTLQDKRVLLLGVSYREDVGDTRYSPSQIFVEEALKRGAKILCHDPLVKHWAEIKMDVLTQFPAAEDLDIVVFAVPHREYSELDFKKWLRGNRPMILDSNNVLNRAQRKLLRSEGCVVASIGRGEGL